MRRKVKEYLLVGEFAVGPGFLVSVEFTRMLVIRRQSGARHVMIKRTIVRVRQVIRVTSAVAKHVGLRWKRMSPWRRA